MISDGGTLRNNTSGSRGKKRRIYLLGGTSFARKLVTGLQQTGHTVRLSVATPLGQEVVKEQPSGGVQVGRLDGPALAADLRGWEAHVLVDAGHPYARELRKTAEDAADQAGVPLIRACRGPWCPETEDYRVRSFRDERELTGELARSGTRAFFTVGAKGLGPFAGTGVIGGTRILPTTESVAEAHAHGLKTSKIIAAYPPYSAAFTAACMQHFGCSVLVSKESGHEGGLDAKLEAVRRLDGRLFILRKPEESRDPAFDLEQVVARLEKL